MPEFYIRSPVLTSIASTSGTFESMTASISPSGAKSLSTSSRARPVMRIKSVYMLRLCRASSSSPFVSGKNRYYKVLSAMSTSGIFFRRWKRLTMIGTQTVLSTPKMMYVFHPIFLIAGGVMYTIMKLQIQFAAVEMDEPFWRALRGRISEG